MDNANVNVEENVNNQATGEAQGTNDVPQNEPPKNEPDLNKEDNNSDKKTEAKPTFKEKFISGAKTIGNGCKTVAKAIKPYAVGAAIGIGAAAYAGLKIYKAVKDGEGGEALGKQDTPLLDGPSDGMDYSGEGLTNDFESDVVDTVEVGDVQMEDFVE